MTVQPQLLNMSLIVSDVVKTPKLVARDMVDFFKPAGRILDPCCGDGVFIQYLQSAEWCEIDKGRDFFQWTEHVDWVFGNPPYSIYSQWIRHSMEIADNICYLIPLNKPFNSSKMILEWMDWGRIIHMRYYASGGALGFPIGFACGAVHFQRGYTGPMYSSIASSHLY